MENISGSRSCYSGQKELFMQIAKIIDYDINIDIAAVNDVFSSIRIIFLWMYTMACFHCPLCEQKYMFTVQKLAILWKKHIWKYYDFRI